MKRNISGVPIKTTVFSQATTTMDETYHDPSHPAAYGGVSLLAKSTKKSKRQAQKYLRANATYRKFFQSKAKIERARVLVPSLGHTFQADLFDLRKYSRQNSGYKYILLVVDCFSRLVCARAIKNKTASQVAEALGDIFQQLRREDRLAPRALLGTDLGTEFYNTDADRVYNEFGIGHFALRKPKKSSLAEISGRWLLDRIYKHMHATGKNIWAQLLPQFVHAKNARPNRALGGRSSDEVTYAKQDEVYRALYGVSKRRPELPLAVGQKVLIVKERLPFHKSFHGYFGDKVYEISMTHDYEGIYRYTLIDTTDGVEISGTFYRQELFPIE